jgi:hypothetical protein
VSVARFICVAGSLAGFAGLGLGGAGAGLASVDGGGERIETSAISCTGGSFSLSLSPAVRSVVLGGGQTVRFTGTMDLGLCSSAKYPKIHHGKMVFKATATAGCDITFITGFIRNGTGQGSITWDTGQRSTFDNASWQGSLKEIQLRHANIGDGLLAGGTVELTAVTDANIVSNATGCSAFGIDHLQGQLRGLEAEGPFAGELPPCSVPTGKRCDLHSTERETTA